MRIDTLLFEDPTCFIVCPIEEFGVRSQMPAEVFYHIHFGTPQSLYYGVRSGMEVVRMRNALVRRNDPRTKEEGLDTVPALTVEGPLVAFSASKPSCEQVFCRRAAPPPTELERVAWRLLWNYPCL